MAGPSLQAAVTHCAANKGLLHLRAAHAGPARRSPSELVKCPDLLSASKSTLRGAGGRARAARRRERSTCDRFAPRSKRVSSCSTRASAATACHDLLLTTESCTGDLDMVEFEECLHSLAVCIYMNRQRVREIDAEMCLFSSWVGLRECAGKKKVVSTAKRHPKRGTFANCVTTQACETAYRSARQTGPRLTSQVSSPVPKHLA